MRCSSNSSYTRFDYSPLTFRVYYSPITSDGIDFNHDGQLDEKWIYKDYRISRVISDRNLDGKEDVTHHYDRHGLIYITKSEDDFDGPYETTSKYKRGNVYLQESDTNNDGHTGYRAHLKHGVFSEVELIEPHFNTTKKKADIFNEQIDLFRIRF